LIYLLEVNTILPLLIKFHDMGVLIFLMIVDEIVSLKFGLHLANKVAILGQHFPRGAFCLN